MSSASTQSPDSLTNSEAEGESSEGSDILEHLTDLIEVVQTCLSEHSAMQSTEIRDAAKALSEIIRGEFNQVCVCVCVEKD